ncbi:MAG: hypothetical protein JNK94_04285 [Hyphomonadaceae bacterium]|nr:hypothetical protein [Hyphomonadaceae bacterium]MBX3510057.1 hypothetical protein [Hyphomonadaceae bacterium]
MLHTFRALIAACAAFAAAGFAPADRFDLTLTPLVSGGALGAIQVDLAFRGDADGQTDLRLPGSWGGQDELWRSIEGLEAVSGAVLQPPGEDPSARTLTHAPNARIQLRYRIVQDFSGPPAPVATGNPYRAIVQPGYFHIIGETVLVAPGHLDQRTPVRFRVRNLPRGWSFASDLQHPGLVFANIWSSVAVGGDYRLRWGGDRNIRVAIRGDWSFSDAAFTTQVTEIIAGHRRFWGDRSTPYLVTVTQIYADNPGVSSIGGAGLSDAFAFFATPNAQLGVITRTLAHESMHTWVPERLGAMPQGAEEPADYWFSEGFTDFYTGRALVREGVWTPTQFAQDFNEMLAGYAQSPVATAPNARVVADFWNSRDVQRLPYQRGRMLATLWDQRLRASGRGMDEVMREIRRRVEAGDTRRARDIFFDVIAAAGVDAAPDFTRYESEGEILLLPSDLFAPCGRIETGEAWRFHRGFDIEATEANNRVITGVVRTSPAYAAGLRDGMVLIRREAGEIGNADVEIAYVVRDGESERTIRYMPRSGDRYTRQRLVLEADLSGEILAQCRTALAG